MKNHEWVAILQFHLTDKEAAKAYTFDRHGKQVILSKMRADDGFVDVGCFRCEQPYQLVHDKYCVLDELGNKHKGIDN